MDIQNLFTDIVCDTHIYNVHTERVTIKHRNAAVAKHFRLRGGTIRAGLIDHKCLYMNVQLWRNDTKDVLMKSLKTALASVSISLMCHICQPAANKICWGEEHAGCRMGVKPLKRLQHAVLVFMYAQNENGVRKRWWREKGNQRAVVFLYKGELYICLWKLRTIKRS